MRRALLILLPIWGLVVAKVAEGADGHGSIKLEEYCTRAGPNAAVDGLLEMLLESENFRVVETRFAGVPKYVSGSRFCAKSMGLEPDTFRMSVELRLSNTQHPPWSGIYAVSWVMREVLPVPTRRIQRGETLDSSTFRQAEIEVGDEVGRYVDSVDKLVGRIAKGLLLPGRLIPRRLIEEPAVVFRGRQVVARVKVGKMQVTMTGEALEDGAMGEMVKILNPRSKQILHGVVRGNGTVEVH